MEKEKVHANEGMKENDRLLGVEFGAKQFDASVLNGRAPKHAMSWTKPTGTKSNSQKITK